jgi:hypothetical protein
VSHASVAVSVRAYRVAQMNLSERTGRLPAVNPSKKL